MKGIWFFGLSGSGKTFASNFIKKKIEKSFIIDGDEIRKHISYDLGYTQKDRLMQIQRVLGLGRIAIKQKLFPIISTVYFSNKICKICKQLNIFPIKVIRKNMTVVMKKHTTYKNKKNIVGKDILYPAIKVRKILNNGDKKFCKILNLLIP
jgi:predicted ABC-type ATPase